MTEPASLREELDDRLTGPLAHARGKLVLEDDSREFSPAADVVRPSRLDEVLERFGRPHAGGDPRAVASLWTQWYLGTLVVPSVAAGLLLDRVLPLALGEVEVALHEERAHPVAFRLPHGGRVDPEAEPFERFGPLVRGHLAPLVEAAAPHVGLSAGVLWGNAGRYLRWILDEIEPLEGGETLAAAGRRLLDEPAWPDGWENPLHGSVVEVEEAGSMVPRRRVCCLRYLLPGVDGCGSLCPLPEVRAASTEPT